MKAAARPQAPSAMASLSLRSGKVLRPRESDDCEITSYLEKLQRLVPKTTTADTKTQSTTTRLSKLEVIEKVIEYIAQLEDVLDHKHQKDMDVLECKTARITLAA